MMAPVPRPLPSLALLLAGVGLAALVLLSTTTAVLILATGGSCRADVLGLVCAVIGPTTVLLSVVMVRRLVRRPALTAGRVLAHGTVAGMLNGLLCLLVVLLLSGKIALEALLLAFFAAVAGGILGFLFSAVYLPPVLSFSRRDRWDVGDHFSSGLGTWLVVVAVVCAVLIALSMPRYSFRPATGAQLLISLLVALVPVAALLSARGSLQIWRRDRWLARVRQGLAPGWAVVPEQSLDLAVLVTLPTIGSSPHGAVLARVAEVGGVYRRQEAMTPVARIGP